MKHRTSVPEGKKRYMIGGVITVNVHTEVVASTFEEAREIAKSRGIMCLCLECSPGNIGEEWVTSDEMDGQTPTPYDGNAELDVREL